MSQRSADGVKARRLLWPTGDGAVLGMLAAALNAVSRVAVVPLFVTPLIDTALADPGRLPGLLLTAGVIVVAGSLALWAQDSLLGRAAARGAARARAAAYESLLQRPPGTLPGTSGSLASRVITDVKEVETYVRYGLGSLVAEGVTLVLILAVLIRADALASLLLLVLGVPAVWALRRVGASLQRASTDSMEGTESLGLHLQEGVKHHETIAAFDARPFMLRRFADVNERTARATTRRSLLAAVQVPLTQVMLFAALGALVVVLTGSVQRGELSVGGMVSFLTLVALAATPAQLLPAAYAMYRQAAAAAQRIEGLTTSARTEGSQDMNAPGAHAQEAAAPIGATGGAAYVTRRAPSPPSEASPPSGAGLSLNGLATGFEPGQPVIAGLDLELPERGLVVVKGPSGVGKTTLLRTLLGLLRPLAGEVRWRGRDLGELPDAELRRLFAYVPQGHELVSGTVRDALSMGRAVADDALWRGLVAAGVADVIKGLPGGLSAPLGEDGAGLSGGQRQRLAIARALVGGPAALLLDEPTSNLDEATEAGVVALLSRLASERLVLAVTHRPTLAAAADVVVELEPRGRATVPAAQGTP